MRTTLIAFIAAATVGLALATAAQTPTGGHIVTIDLNRIFNEYYKTPIASAKLKETVESFNKEQEEMVNNYKKAIDELNKLRDEQDEPEYSAEIREQKHKAVADKLADTQKLQRDIEEYRASHRKILEDQTQRMRQTILKEVQDVISKEARDAGYQMVLDESGNTLNGVPILVFSQDSLEITDDIIKVLNKNQPKTADMPKPADKKDDKKGDKK